VKGGLLLVNQCCSAARASFNDMATKLGCSVLDLVQCRIALQSLVQLLEPGSY